MTRCGGSFCYPSPQGTEAGGLAGDLSQVQAQPGMHSKFQPKLHSKTMSEKQTKQNKNPKKATMVTQPPQAKVEEFPRHIKKKKYKKCTSVFAKGRMHEAQRQWSSCDG